MDVVFNAEKMENLIWIDRFLMHQFIDIIKKNPQKFEKALEIVFNTDVLEDSVMERKYNAI